MLKPCISMCMYHMLLHSRYIRYRAMHCVIRSIVYSNKAFSSLPGSFYCCYRVYRMLISCLIHWSRRNSQGLCGLPRLLWVMHSNGIHNWPVLGLSSCYAYTQQYRMGYSWLYPSNGSSHRAALFISTSTFFTIPYGLGPVRGLSSNL